MRYHGTKNCVENYCSGCDGTRVGCLGVRGSLRHAGGHGVDTSPPYKLQFFTPAENELVDQLTEIIIPADAHSPGAHAAQVSLFADLMIATSNDAVKEQWREGLRLFHVSSSVGAPAAARLPRNTSTKSRIPFDENSFTINCAQMSPLRQLPCPVQNLLTRELDPSCRSARSRPPIHNDSSRIRPSVRPPTSAQRHL